MNLNRLAGGLVAAVVAAAAALAGPFTSAAAAHTASSYYPHRWPLGVNVSYGLNSGFPGGSFSDRVFDGKQTWNAAAGTEEPAIFWTLSDYVNYGSFTNPCGLSSGTNTAVWFWWNLDPIAGTDAAGATDYCYVNNTITKATLAYDSTRSNYWTSSSTGVAGGSVDAWSVASHEWGHSTGWRWHFGEGESGVCDTLIWTGRHTMCPAIANGTSMQRNLATHDIHTFTAAYW